MQAINVFWLQNTKQHVHGVLDLVDLDGTERLSKSGAMGERLKETQVLKHSFMSLKFRIEVL